MRDVVFYHQKLCMKKNVGVWLVVLALAFCNPVHSGNNCSRPRLESCSRRCARRVPLEVAQTAAASGMSTAIAAFTDIILPNPAHEIHVKAALGAWGAAMFLFGISVELVYRRDSEALLRVSEGLRPLVKRYQDRLSRRQTRHFR